MRGRVPALVQIKYDRMAGSPFGFFRGAVPVMACDLSLGPNTGIRTQLCGDAHVRNLGAFAAPDGRLVFDLNDFDETIRGPFEWDVKRMAASLILAGREAGAKHSQCRAAAAAFLASYRIQMQLFARMPPCRARHSAALARCPHRPTRRSALDPRRNRRTPAPRGRSETQSPHLQVRPARPHPHPRRHCPPGARLAHHLR
jgi:uncharacterized protein (DUF2252 family)